MDMSIIDSEERPTNVNEVSDYATEIHTHLREMEVRIWKLNVLRVNFNDARSLLIGSMFMLCHAG